MNPSDPFRLGINMAGAVSAGAYTAGVFDFLIQALQQWEAAKVGGQNVPRHKVLIEVLTGASAGGIVTGLGSLSLYDETKQTPNPTRLYETWVEGIAIADLLKTDDLKDDNPVLSVLDSSILDVIADNQVRWKTAPTQPSYVSSNLTLYLSLTNLRGVPYSVDVANDGLFEENTLYHADQIQFEMLPPQTAAKSNLSYQLPVNNPQAAGWQKLKESALATSAFPVGLRPRNVSRTVSEYQNKLWTISTPGKCNAAGDCVCEKLERIGPAWDAPNVNTPFDTVSVDGGVTNNNPFECARRHLASIGGSPSDHNVRDAFQADRAVLTIAPFPGAEAFSNSYNTAKRSTLFGMLPDLLSALISQSRFQGESLSLLKDESVFSRFVIAPVDEKAVAPMHALQSGSLGAFGGFLHRGFRERDYQLGRRNCQRFLKEHFVLPIENPLMAQGLGASREALINEFSAKDPNAPSPPNVHTAAWMPIIPLCGTAKVEVTYPVRSKIPNDDLDDTVAAAVSRLIAVAAQIAKGNGFAAWFFGIEVRIALRVKGRSWLKQKIVAELKPEESV
jgi:hypothetical protein